LIIAFGCGACGLLLNVTNAAEYETSGVRVQCVFTAYDSVMH
jgi:hypothetical protein